MNRCGFAVAGMLAPRLQQPRASTPAASPRRYSNTLKEQQRFKAAANELLQGPPPQGVTQPAVDPQTEKLEKALLAATTTARELAGRVQVSCSSRCSSCAGKPLLAQPMSCKTLQDASLKLASGGESEACVQHASKAAQMLRARLEVVLSQAGSPGLGSPREATMASAVASLDELNSSLQLRDEARHLKQCLVSWRGCSGCALRACCFDAGSAGAASRRGSCAGRCGLAPWRGRL